MEEYNSLIDEKKNLLKLKDNYLAKINRIDIEINSIINRIYEKCIKINNGHIMVQEREEAPYGEIFYYCKFCGYES